MRKMRAMLKRGRCSWLLLLLLLLLFFPMYLGENRVFGENGLEEKHLNTYVQVVENEPILIGVEKDKMTVLHFYDEPDIEAKNPFEARYILMDKKVNRLVITPKQDNLKESFLVMGQSGTHYMIQLVSVSSARGETVDAVKRIRRKEVVVSESQTKNLKGEKYFWDFMRAMIYAKIPPGADASWTLGKDSEDITAILKMDPRILEVKTVRKYIGPNNIVGIVAHAVNKTDHPVRVLLPEVNFRGFRAAHAYPDLIMPAGSTRPVYDRGRTIDVYTDTATLYIIMEEGAKE